MTLHRPGCDAYYPAREMRECADGQRRCSPCAARRALHHAIERWEAFTGQTATREGPVVR